MIALVIAVLILVFVVCLMAGVPWAQFLFVNTLIFVLPFYLTYRNIRNSITGEKKRERLLVFGAFIGAVFYVLLALGADAFVSGKNASFIHSNGGIAAVCGFIVLLTAALVIVGFYADKVKKSLLFAAIAVTAAANAMFIFATAYIGIKVMPKAASVGSFTVFFWVVYNVDLLILSVRYIKGALK